MQKIDLRNKSDEHIFVQKKKLGQLEKKKFTSFSIEFLKNFSIKFLNIVHLDQSFKSHLFCKKQLHSFDNTAQKNLDDLFQALQFFLTE